MQQVNTFPIELGLVVYGTPGGNLARTDKDRILEGTVEKIGRTYFYVRFYKGCGYTVKFSIADFSSHCADCNSSIKLYPSVAAIQEHRTTQKKLTAIRKALEPFGQNPLSDSSIQKIYDILCLAGEISPISE